MGRDLRHGVRRLLRSPGFSLAAILTLALGIGASTAIFSVVHAVVISPLPYPDSERLVSLTHAAPGADIARLGFSLGSYVHYRELNRTFDEMTRHRGALATLQVALALVLLVGAGLMVRSFWHLENLDPGFDETGVLTFRLTLPELDYSDRARSAQFQQRVLDRIAGLGGVQAWVRLPVCR